MTTDPSRPRFRRPLLMLSAGLLLAWAAHAGWFERQNSAGATHVTLATWNLEWLMSPGTQAELQARCTRQQPASDERALPCTPGRTPPPTRHEQDFQALSRTAQALRDHWAPDVVALQEVDGPEAARLVFTSGWRLDCFSRRAHPQKTGFAIREGLPYQCNPELVALDVDGTSRAGTDITLYPGTSHAIRLLNVHLKSGCFDGKLDRSFAPCQRLRQQVPVVEAWIDHRVKEGVAFAVLGDFNRHLDRDARFDAGEDEAAPLNVFAAWSDDQPKGAILHRATTDQAYVPCDAQDRHSRYIDDILISDRLRQRFGNARFGRQAYAPADAGRQLSDHCPLVWSLQR
ncbi:hypothetical protein [Aquabacterium sp.]|uniref:hypothetical protein n=1 Tax=Aquabacterium sp. TaxID=1872578 RepID=UPI0035B4E146